MRDACKAVPSSILDYKNLFEILVQIFSIDGCQSQMVKKKKTKRIHTAAQILQYINSPLNTVKYKPIYSFPIGLSIK